MIEMTTRADETRETARERAANGTGFVMWLCMYSSWFRNWSNQKCLSPHLTAAFPEEHNASTHFLAVSGTGS